jgi:NADPH-dependent 2,4-dienoyl-CoA reductase/sulfur reductase-like enzyme
MRPRTEIRLASGASGTVHVELSDGSAISVDRIILATGYKPALSRVPFLAEDGLLRDISTRNASPLLDDTMQCSVPGLYFTSMLATETFGPFFAFTVSARASAALITRGIERGAA